MHVGVFYLGIRVWGFGGGGFRVEADYKTESPSKWPKAPRPPELKPLESTPKP